MPITGADHSGFPQIAEWICPDVHPQLKQNEVHVWKIGLLASLEQLDQMRALLCDEERQRADRFSHERHRRRFIVGRAVMRMLLGRYSGIRPEALEFLYNAHGKPSIQGIGVPDFNFTNCRDLALLCLARERLLGIDLEHFDRHADYEGLMNRYFAHGEVRALSRIPQSRRRAAFLAGWTRKEAYIKALGKGLSLPLSCFEVSIDPQTPPALVHVDGQPEEPDRWRFAALSPGSGFVATLAVEGHGCDVRHYSWQD